jgi:plasmid stability protein
MRTTLDLDDQLMREAKKRAAEEERTLTALVQDALRQYLAPDARPREPFRLRLLSKKGRVAPRVNFADRDALYERMEGRG